MDSMREVKSIYLVISNILSTLLRPILTVLLQYEILRNWWHILYCIVRGEQWTVVALNKTLFISNLVQRTAIRLEKIEHAKTSGTLNSSYAVCLIEIHNGSLLLFIFALKNVMILVLLVNTSWISFLKVNKSCPRRDWQPCLKVLVYCNYFITIGLTFLPSMNINL